MHRQAWLMLLHAQIRIREAASAGFSSGSSSLDFEQPQQQHTLPERYCTNNTNKVNGHSQEAKIGTAYL